MVETVAERRSLAAVLATVVVISVGFALFVPDFLSAANLLNVMTTSAFTGILALGLLVVLLAGGLDISFTAIATIVQFSIAVLMSKVILGWTGSLISVLFLGALFGLFNGWVVTRLKTAPIIVTIALLNIYFGIVILVSRGEMIYDFPEFFWDGVLWRSGPVRVTVQIAALVTVAALTAFLLGQTSLGRILRAAGGNAEALSRQGISLLRINLFAYGWLGALAGLAGLMQTQLLQAVMPGALIGKELEVVAAVVLGGATLAGGRGTVAGTLLGVFLIALLQNGMTLMGVSPYWHQVTIGLILLASLLLPLVGARRSGAATETRLS